MAKEPGDFGISELSELYVNGIKVTDLAEDSQTTFKSQVVDYNERFWATPPRPINHQTNDILIVKFSGKKLINYLSFEHSAFPHNISAWFLINEAEWLPSLNRVTRFYDRLLDHRGRAISKTFRGANPYVVNTALTRSAGIHPHHHGQGHWMFHEVNLKPIETEAIAFVLNRNVGSGQRGPVDETDTPVPYSLGVRNLDVGYRIRDKDDVPRTNRDPLITTEYESFTQVTDVAGSMVELKLRENRAEDLLQQKLWRSEPQPVSYSVVNLYVDSRDAEGNPQVIDRFFIDPVTSGPHMNLYYSNEEPDVTDFAASDSPLGFPLVSPAGPGTIRTDANGIRFPNEIGFIDVSNRRLQWSPADPFWIGMNIQPFWEAGTEERHVILDTGSFRLEYFQGRFQVVTPNGLLSMDNSLYENEDVPPVEEEDALEEEPTDPEEEEFVDNSEYYEDNESVYLVFGYDGENAFFYTPRSGMIMAEATPPTSHPEVIRFGSAIGQTPDPYIPTGNYRLNSFVLKREALDWFPTDDPLGSSQTPHTDGDEEGDPIFQPDDSEAPDDGPGGSPEEDDSSDDPTPTPDDPSEESEDPDLLPVVEDAPSDVEVLVPLPVVEYLADPVAFNRKAPFVSVADDRTRNALLRMLPEFITSGGISSVNPYGFLGGPINYYDRIKWTPITRDYKLRRGTMQFYPTKARFFKFEFTNLTPQPYEVHTPVTRDTKIYASDVNKMNEAIHKIPNGSETTIPGIHTQKQLGEYFLFADAVRYAARGTTGQDVSPIEALYAQSLREKERLDQFGSMYQFHPWHPSAQTPRNQQYREHYYETVSVEMKQRVAYFVGLSQLLMYRQDYHTDDDTEEYIETFQDLSFIDEGTFNTRMVPGYINAIHNPSFEGEDILESWTVVDEGDTDNATLDRLDNSDGQGTSAYGQHFAHVHSTVTDDDTSLVGITQTVTKDDVPGIFPEEGTSFVSFSFYARNPGLNGVIVGRVEAYDGASLEEDVEQIFEYAETETNWTRYKMVLEVSEDVDSIEVSIYTMANPDAGDYLADLYLDAIQLESGATTSQYIDGSFDGAIWMGEGQSVPDDEDDVETIVKGPDAPSQTLDRIEQPWEWHDDYIKSPASLIHPVTLESDVFKSRRNVRGVQFATTQSASRQLLNDSHLKDEHITFWSPTGDVPSLDFKPFDSNSLGEMMEVTRFPGANIYGEMEITYPSWGTLEEHIWEELEGDIDNESIGGIRYNQYVFTSEEGRLYAAARVYTDTTLSSPLSLQIIDRNNSVLAEKTVMPRARGVTEWWVPFNIGDTGEFEDRTWGDVELMDPDPLLPTYADLELYQWRDLVSAKFQEAREVSVQIVQQGPSKDTFYVDNISLFEDAIRWQFSNDGGSTWHDAYGIKNNPTGVLIFPPVANPAETPQNKLKWRVTGYRPNLYVGNLTIRPWYGGMIHGVQHRNYGISFGPNLTPTDQFDEPEKDPFFQNYLGPLPQDWYFNFRQLLLIDREYIPVERTPRPKGFGNLYSGYLDPDAPQPPSGLQDIYPGTYSFIYGVPESENSYVNFYDPENIY